MRLIRLLIRLICTLLLTLFAAAALGQAAGDVDESRLAAVRRAFNAMELGDTIARVLKNAMQERAAPGKPVPDYIREAVTAPAVETRWVPIYAKHISTDTALEVARFFESRIGRKASYLMFNPYALTTSVDLTERNFITAFMKGPVWLSWQRGIKNSEGEVSQTVRAWMQDLAAVNMAGALGPGGGAMVENYLGLMKTLAERTKELRAQYSAELAGFGMDGLLAPARVTSSEGLADSRMKLSGYEKTLEQYLAAVSALLSEAHGAVKRLNGPEEYLRELTRGFERSLAGTYDRDLRFAENQRQMIDTARRVLTLAEEQLGKTRLENGILVFQDAAALDNYRALFAQLDALARTETEILQEAGKASQRSQGPLAEQSPR